MKVKSMVTDGAPPQYIRKYLARYIQWWNETVGDWSKAKPYSGFVKLALISTPAAYAAGLLLRQNHASPQLDWKFFTVITRYPPT